MSSRAKLQKTLPQQSDVVIHPDGRVSISFLWEDLRGLEQELQGTSLTDEKANPAPQVTTKFYRPEFLIFPKAEYQKCNLCPKECGYDRVASAHPSCGDMEFRVSTVGLTFGDEKPISGTRGSGAVMLSGCSLKCFSCHNPEMVAHGKKVTPSSFIALAFSLAEKGAHNLQILSPTVHFPSLRQVLAELKRLNFPIPIIFKSSGYERVEELKKFQGLVDIYVPDLKFGPSSRLAIVAGVADYFDVTSKAINEMIRQVGPLEVDCNGVAYKGVLVRHVKAPIAAHESEAISAYLQNLPKGVGVSINDNFVMLSKWES